MDEVGELPIGENPQAYDQVLKAKDSKLWLKAIQEKLDFMEKNKVWEVVDLP